MRLSMDIDHVFAKRVTEFILIDRICRSRMDILVFEFERYDIIRKIKKKKIGGWSNENWFVPYLWNSFPEISFLYQTGGISR